MWRFDGATMLCSGAEFVFENGLFVGDFNIGCGTVRFAFPPHIFLRASSSAAAARTDFSAKSNVIPFTGTS